MEVCLIAFTGEANDGNKLLLNVDRVESGGNPTALLLSLLPVSASLLVGSHGMKLNPEVLLDNWGVPFPSLCVCEHVCSAPLHCKAPS